MFTIIVALVILSALITVTTATLYALDYSANAGHYWAVKDAIKWSDRELVEMQCAAIERASIARKIEVLTYANNFFATAV